MELITKLFIALIALQHIYILWLEMFAWTTKAPKVFSNFPRHLFPETKALAANQGLYNGFLSAGLIWSLFICNIEWQIYVAIFFLSCIAVAGIYGGISANKRIFFIQGIPALITLLLVITRYMCF